MGTWAQLPGWLPVTPPTLIHLRSAAPPGLGMEVMAPATINALNGSSVKLSCTFNSCYKVENKQFSLNWTYQECSNCSEELVSLAGGPWTSSKGVPGVPHVQGGGAWLGNEPVGC